MTAKEIFPSSAAKRDVAHAIGYYVEEAGRDVARAFTLALETAYGLIGKSPALGSPRYAEQLNLPALRHLPLKRFPFLVFYVETSERIEIWRVLHSKRDIPGLLVPDQD